MPSALQTSLIRRNIVTRSKTVRLVLGAAFVLALAWVPPVVYAHGGDPTLIHACVRNNNGDVRIVSPNTSCPNNETAVDWPGTAATPGQGSIILHSSSIDVPGPAFLGPLRCIGFLETCAYRSPRDGTIQNMRVFINFNTLPGPTVLVLFVNGSPTLLSTSIPAGSPADIDVPGMVDILDGDRISVMLDTSAVPEPPAGQPANAISITVSYEVK
jgi:hypothetical protein